jgi:hypothetical protein
MQLRLPLSRWLSPLSFGWLYADHRGHGVFPDIKRLVPSITTRFGFCGKPTACISDPSQLVLE